MGRAIRMGLGFLIAMQAWGCANQLDPDAVRAGLAERDRDSVLAGSAVPGAGAVGRALAESDRAARRAASLDSLDR
jgi:hypothetical protein